MYTREPNSSAGGELLNLLGAPRPELPKPVDRTFLAEGVYQCEECRTAFCLCCEKKWGADERFCCDECRQGWNWKHKTPRVEPGLARAQAEEVD